MACRWTRKSFQWTNYTHLHDQGKLIVLWRLKYDEGIWLISHVGESIPKSQALCVDMLTFQFAVTLKKDTKTKQTDLGRKENDRFSIYRHAYENFAI